MATVFPEWGEGEWPGASPQARDSLVLSRERQTSLQGRQLWGSYTSRDPLVTFKPNHEGFELSADDTVAVIGADDKRLVTIPYPQRRKETYVRIEVAGSPPRTLRIASLEPR